MRILFLLLVASSLLLIGCDKSVDTPLGPTEDLEEGGVAVTFRSSSAKKLSGLPEPTNVRLVVRRFDSNQLAFNTLSDVQVPTDTTVIIRVPANTGYQLDAFSYIDSTRSLNPILKMGQVQGLTVRPGEVTEASLILKPPVPTFVIPDTVMHGESFDVSVAVDGFYIRPRVTGNFDVGAYLSVDSTYVNDFSRSLSPDHAINYGESTTLSWSTVSVSGFFGRPAYLQIRAYLNAEEFYRSSESMYSFVWNYPNPFAPDTISTYVAAPDGGIGVEVIY